MATIFQKTAGEQCLILGVREALIYPFNAGTWNRIRIGWYWSFVNSTDDNGKASEETQFNTASNNKNSVWIGVKDSGIALPRSAGSFFAGMGHSSSSSRNCSIEVNSNAFFGCQNGDVYGQFCISQGTLDTSFEQGFVAFTKPTVDQSTGSASYAAYQAIDVVSGNGANNKPVIVVRQCQFSAVKSSYSETNLRSSILNDTPQNVIGSGYVTTHLSPTGTPVEYPNSFFIYSPFTTARIRIHGIAIEKIS